MDKIIINDGNTNTNTNNNINEQKEKGEENDGYDGGIIITSSKEYFSSWYYSNNNNNNEKSSSSTIINPSLPNNYDNNKNNKDGLKKHHHHQQHQHQHQQQSIDDDDNILLYYYDGEEEDKFKNPLVVDDDITTTTSFIKSMMKRKVSSLLSLIPQQWRDNNSNNNNNNGRHHRAVVEIIAPSSTTTTTTTTTSSSSSSSSSHLNPSSYYSYELSLLMSLSNSPFNNNIIIFIVVVIIVLIITMIIKKARYNNNNNNNNPTTNNRNTTMKDNTVIRSRQKTTFEQMQVLRSTRERSSTFDFFGMNINKRTNNNNNININNNNNRERSPSLDSTSGHHNHPTPFSLDYRTRSFHKDGSTTEFFKRERMGSMDLFYPTTTTTQQQQQQQQRRGGGGDVPIPAQLLNNSTHHDRATAMMTTTTTATGQDENNAAATTTEGLLYDEFGLVTLSYEVEYYGPSRKRMTYSTWTPPTSWSEASRRIIPQDIMTKLRRSINLHLPTSKVMIHAPDSTGKWDSTFDIENVSIRIVPPVEGGVLNLYVKGTSKKEWTEYTFDSARDAAQFQLDLIAYQVLGRTVHTIFEALSLVHRGSIAYNGPEFVLHNDERFDVNSNKSSEGKDDDDEKDESQQHPRYSSESCVAWDDAMRSMSSIPTIRIALERLWLNHPLGPNYDTNKSPDHHKNKSSPSSPPPSSSGAGGKPSTEALLLTDEYVNKRLLLGPVDFFRLFVPVLPETAFPQSESNRSRMEQLLSWRKRASRAAVLVRSYVASHRVVNLGWHPRGGVVMNSNKLTRRLAFDVGDDNNRRDKSSRNEYYEASVSRDVLCHVRPFDYFEQKESAASTSSSSSSSSGGWWWSRFITTTKSSFQQRRLVLSPYQAYSLVGVQVFKLPENNNEAGNQVLHPAHDPVEAFPTLSKLIADNPHLNFFVVSFFHRRSVSVFCYVRSLPEGIDPQFDNVMNRFRKGAKDYRDQRVNLMIQLGHNLELTFLGWAVLRILSFLFNLTKKGRESPLVLEATRDRTPFPAVRLSSYAETHHFGGSLQTNKNLPTNYVSLTSCFQPQSMPNQISKLLFSTLEGKLSEQVLDFTFAIEGEREDELPERALCTTRMVNVHTWSVARERPCEAISNEKTGEIDGIASTDQRTGMEHRNIPGNNAYATQNNAESNSGLDVAAREVSQLLEGVQVPSRRNFTNHEAGAYSEFPSDLLTGVVRVRSLFSEQDMKRFIQSCHFDLKAASIRIVETAAWRARTFPIDTRKCRIELQNGQFFQQGFDKEMNPVFYFRNICLGPWRKNPDAVISCVLYRLDASLAEFCRTNPKTKCTVVILMGRPPSTIPSGDEIASCDGAQEGSDLVDEDGKESLCSSQQSLSVVGDVSLDSCNPRIDQGERWHKHTNREMIRTICALLASHYPDRLARALIIRGNGKNTYFSTILQGRALMKQFVTIPSIRQKVKFVRNASELTQWINADQLVTIVGGRSPVQEQAFQC